MNWDYIAGIIDGEGCIGLYIDDAIFDRTGTLVFTPCIQITCRYSPEIDIMKEFMISEGIKIPSGNKKIAVYSWKSIKILCEKLSGRLYIKAKELELMKKVVVLYFSLPFFDAIGRRKTSLKQNEFVKLAIELKKYKSGKGIKKDYSQFLRGI